MDADYQSQTEPLTGNNITRAYKNGKRSTAPSLCGCAHGAKWETLRSCWPKWTTKYGYGKRENGPRLFQACGSATVDSVEKYFDVRIPKASWFAQRIGAIGEKDPVIGFGLCRCWKKHGVCTQRTSTMVVGQNLDKHGVCFCLAHEREQRQQCPATWSQLLRLSHFDIHDVQWSSWDLYIRHWGIWNVFV